MAVDVAIDYGEHRLVERATAGDPAAFDALVEPHAERLYRYAFRLLGDHEAAEDVRQETLVRAFRCLHTFRGQAAFSTWLYAIVTRLCLSWRRRWQGRRAELSIEDTPLVALWADPEARMLAREAAARVQRVLAALHPTYRAVIVLKYLEGMGHEEIAAVLGCSPETSRTRLTRARRIFRTLYERTE